MHFNDAAQSCSSQASQSLVRSTCSFKQAFLTFPLQIAGHIELASIAEDALLRDPATELTDSVKRLRQRNYKARRG